MKQIHMIKWTNSKKTGGVYSDYEKACKVAEIGNKQRNWWNRLCGDEWVVKTYDVKD